MKITESQLRNIIKQEVSKIIKENEAQPEQQNSGLDDQIQTLFKQIESLDSKIKAHKEYGMEYPKLVQQFVQHYRSGGGTKLVIQNENNEVVPLAAVAAYQAVFGRRS
jgi:hypothetical protein